MKTVIQVIQHLRPGGIETMVLDLQRFAAQDERTIIISLEGDRNSALADWPRLREHAKRIIFLNKQPGFSFKLLVELRRLFRILKADCVHTHHIGPLIYAGLAARLAGIKRLIHTEHDAWHLTDMHRRTLQRWTLRLTRPLLVADAMSVARGVRTHLQQRQVRIIRNGIDSERFRPGDQHFARQQLGLPDNVQLVGCSGRLEVVKGQAVLLEALSQLPQETHVALAGIGTTEQALKDQAKRLGIEQRVHFLGRTDEMPTFYQALDLFCLPSFHEGMPLSPLEAQACGIPALLTDTGGCREALCPESGRLVTPGKPDEMAEAITEMLIEQPHRNPRDFVKSEGDVRLMAKAYNDLHKPLHRREV
ncbi:MAG: glycosyltransferase [Sedimenticola sp.]